MKPGGMKHGGAYIGGDGLYACAGGENAADGGGGANSSCEDGGGAWLACACWLDGCGWHDGVATCVGGGKMGASARSATLELGALGSSGGRSCLVGASGDERSRAGDVSVALIFEERGLACAGLPTGSSAGKSANLAMASSRCGGWLISSRRKPLNCKLEQSRNCVARWLASGGA